MARNSATRTESHLPEVLARPAAATRPPERAWPPGIRRRATNWQVFARVRGEFRSRSFALDTDIHELKRQRDLLKTESYYGERIDAAHGPTFAEDARAYLKLVESMPSFDDRKYDIECWVEAFRGRARSSIAGRDIQHVLERWRKSGKVNGEGLSPSSLNKRRTALMSLWTRLDGKGAANPVKDVPEYDESESEQIRALPPRTMARLIGRIGRSHWKIRRKEYRGKRRAPSKTRARLWLMLCTGWPQAQVMRLKAEHIDLAKEAVWIASRRKGKGAKGRWLPLVPGAIRALQRFIAADAWGDFSTSGMHKSFQLALEAENAHRVRWKKPAIPHASPYTARHTFGTELAKVVKDERVIQEMMLLTNPAQVRRYTEAATADRLEAARAQLQRLVKARAAKVRSTGAKVARSKRKVARR